MTIDLVTLIIAGAATWRLSSLIAREDGPWEVFAKFRAIIGVKYDATSRPFGSNVIAEGIICTWCNSVWIALFIVVFYAIIGEVLLWLLLPFAISAIVIAIDELIGMN